MPKKHPADLAVCYRGRVNVFGFLAPFSFDAINSAKLRLYGQPEGRAFLANFRSRGRRRSPDRLTATRTKINQELLRALPKDLRQAYLASTTFSSFLELRNLMKIALNSMVANMT